MNLYLVEYISDDVYQLLSKEFNIVDDITISECVLSRNLIIDKCFIDKAVNLKVIAIHGSGYDSVDLEYCKSKNILVFNTPGCNSMSVAEANILLMLAISRRIDNAFSCINNNVIDYKLCMGNEIFNKTVGFIGIGNIAILSANILKYGFNCKVIGYNRSKKDTIIEQMSKEEVYKNSDYIIISLELNNETIDFIKLEDIKLMKNTAYIINTARAKIINHDDLLYSLQNKLIKGYASDVFIKEPIDSTDPLLKENVIATPHIGANTEEALYNVAYKCYEGLINYKYNKKIDNLL